MALWGPMTVLQPRAPLTTLSLRQCRQALALSQSSFSARLGVSLETYRTWDSGRRPPRLEDLTTANELALRNNPQALLPLGTLARLKVRALPGAPNSPDFRASLPQPPIRAMFSVQLDRSPSSSVKYFLASCSGIEPW